MTTDALIGPFRVGETWEIDVYCREADRLPMYMADQYLTVEFFEDSAETRPLWPAMDSRTAPGWAWRDRAKGFGRLQVPPELTSTLDDLLDDDLAFITYKVTAYPADGRVSVQAKGRAEIRR